MTNCTFHGGCWDFHLRHCVVRIEMSSNTSPHSAAKCAAPISQLCPRGKTKRRPRNTTIRLAMSAAGILLGNIIATNCSLESDDRTPAPTVVKEESQSTVKDNDSSSAHAAKPRPSTESATSNTSAAADNIGRLSLSSDASRPESLDPHIVPPPPKPQTPYKRFAKYLD